MRVRQLMTSPAIVCSGHDSLEHAANLLWDHDCGSLAVVGDDGTVQAQITDRDVCMCAYTRGARLADLTVADAMSHGVVVCRPQDELAAAADTMRQRRVRRLPVVDEVGKPIGMLSLGDLARHALADPQVGSETIRTLDAICSKEVPLSRPHRVGAGVDRLPVVFEPAMSRTPARRR